MQTLLESDRSPRMELRFDRIYAHIHYVPMDRNGIRLLRILSLPNWHERILEAVFPPDWRAMMPGSMEYDARRGDILILSHLDGDIARIVRLSQSLENCTVPYEVLCFPWQRSFLQAYLGSRVRYREIPMDALEEALDVPG